MHRIVAVINQKGGVSKSTSVHSIGAALAARGNSVLLVDLDAQGNLSYVLGAEDGGFSVFDVLSQTVTAKDAIISVQGIDLLKSAPGLSAADMIFNQTGKEYRLKEALDGLQYDYIIIDTPPALGILTVNALTAATDVLIPAQADIYSLQGIGQLYSTIEVVKRYCNPELNISGILITRYNGRTVLSRDMTDLLMETAERIGTKVYKTPIRESIAVKEAQANRTDLFSYAPKSNAAMDYSSFIDEFLSERN